MRAFVPLGCLSIGLALSTEAELSTSFRHPFLPTAVTVIVVASTRVGSAGGEKKQKDYKSKSGHESAMTLESTQQLEGFALCSLESVPYGIRAV